MNRVLLVDDDVELVGLFRDYLEQDGFEVRLAHDGEAGAALALGERFDIVVLDVMMPRLSGIDALRRIREHCAMPVLMLTAKGDDMDRILGLELVPTTMCPSPVPHGSWRLGCAPSCGERNKPAARHRDSPLP